MNLVKPKTKPKAKTSNKRADSAPRKEIKQYDPDEVVIIGHDTDDGHSHWGYDEDSNKTQLLESDVVFTYENGIIQNVLGRRDGDKIVIVAGRGRTRQLREANKRRKADGLPPWFLPVSIVLGDARKMLVLKHGENAHRREQSPFVRAQAAYELSQQFPEEQAATIMGLSVDHFRDILKLLAVAPAVRDAVLKGDLNQSSAIQLSDLSEADQTTQLAPLLAAAALTGVKPTTRDVKAKVREARGKAPLETPATRIKKVGEILAEIDASATKDDLWGAIKKVQKVLA